MLSIVSEKDGNVVYLHADREGLEIMQKVIARLLNYVQNDVSEHDHLYSAAWAGEELDETMLASERENGCHQVHHLRNL